MLTPDQIETLRGLEMIVRADITRVGSLDPFHDRYRKQADALAAVIAEAEEWAKAKRIAVGIDNGHSCLECPLFQFNDAAGHSCQAGEFRVHEIWLDRNAPFGCPLREGPVLVEKERLVTLGTGGVATWDDGTPSTDANGKAVTKLM